MKRIMMSFELPQAMHNKVTKLAKRDNISKSDVVRYALKHYITLNTPSKKETADGKDKPKQA